MTHPRIKRRRRLFIALAVVCVFIVVIAVVIATNGTRIGLALGIISNDYDGPGHGQVQVRIEEGENGTTIAQTLEQQDVIKTTDPFIEALTQNSDITFDSGLFKLKKEMSAKQAIQALQDPDNRVTVSVVIPEGATADGVFDRLAEATGTDKKEFVELAKDPQALGVPDSFPTIEGYLFPATYKFDAVASAESMLKQLVDRMSQALEEHEVAQDDALNVLTLASIVQREAGQDTDDYAKIARVFQNRLDKDMLLQSDATVAYGTGNLHTVWTTDKERGDAKNEYNTYKNKGLPIGPIGLPGDQAIDAAVHPAKGDWLFFVPVNLETGETKFSKTSQQHEKYVQQLKDWCQAHADKGGKRCD
jgi:UPF0755 protein